MNWKIEATIPSFAVPVLAAGIEYYARLGFELEWQWPEKSATHVGLKRGGCSVMLALCEPAVSADVTFLVDDVDACHAALLEGRAWELAQRAGALAEGRGFPPARACVPPRAPESRAYGQRVFVVIDPWGNSLCFGQQEA